MHSNPSRVNRFKEDKMNGKILVLGVGRIGAEALENVVACGFDDIQIVSELEIDTNTTMI